jgi:hypothetical protein
MPVELVHNQPPPDLKLRMNRLLSDVLVLRALPRSDVRGVYDELEMVRDELSRILDRCDDKSRN